MNSWDATALCQWIKSGGQLFEMGAATNVENNCMYQYRIECDLANPADSTARTLPRCFPTGSDSHSAESDQASVFLRQTAFDCWDISDRSRMHCGRFRDRRTAVRYIRRQFGIAARIIVLPSCAPFPDAPK